MKKVRRPLLFGEVLFDIFPDKSLIGGAPFNVAWHLRGFDLDPLFISRIGDDSLGRQILNSMKNWGMDTSALQWDSTFPTGRVKVSEKDGQPHYAIEKEQAYDYIVDPQMPKDAASGFALLYHGTLALREQHNRFILDRLLKRHPLPCFVDLNLREPWWDSDLVSGTLQRAKWAKMSEEELDIVCRLSDISAMSLESRIDEVARCYQLDILYVTHGDSGSYAWRNNRVVFQQAFRTNDFKDSVGAGDAFTAVCILGLLSGWETDLTMRRAAAFAATICAQRGALISRRARYQQTLEEWTDCEK